MLFICYPWFDGWLTTLDCFVWFSCLHLVPKLSEASCSKKLFSWQVRTSLIIFGRLVNNNKLSLSSHFSQNLRVCSVELIAIGTNWAWDNLTSDWLKFPTTMTWSFPKFVLKIVIWFVEETSCSGQCNVYNVTSLLFWFYLRFTKFTGCSFEVWI